MASVLSILSGNDPNIDDDLAWSARDAASKRKLQEFTPPPKPLEPPPPNPLDTPEATNRFSDAAWNAIFGTPSDNFYTTPAVPPTSINVPDGTKIEQPPSGEFLQDFLRPRPEKNLPPEKILSPVEKEAQDRAQIKNFLRSPESVNLFTVARQRNNQFILQNKIIQDYDKMSMYQFAKRYGMDTLNDMATLGVGGDEIESWVKSTSASGLLDSLRDIGAHGVSTAVSGYADLGAAGIGMTLGSGSIAGQGIDALSEYFGGPKLTKYTDEAAVSVAEVGRNASDAMVNALQSDDSYKAEAVANYETQADHIDEEIEYQKTLRTDGEMIAEMRRFGKNTMHAAARLWENPKHLENLTSQAIGSMATLGPILKGLNLASKGLKATRLGAGALKLAPFSQFETAVGIQSGASTFSDAAVQVMGMEHNDLMATSPEYRAMILSGYSQEEAKTSLASRAGAVAGPAAFVTGALTSALAPEGFEKSLFTRGTRKTFTQGIKELPAIMGKEFIEETPQSAGEQFATNLAIQQHVDENQRLSENVGETGIQGGLAGLFSGPMLKGPGLALKLTAKTVSAPVKLLYNQLAKRADRRVAANEAASGISTENVARDAQAAAESVPALVEGLRSVAEESETARQVAEQNQAQTQQTQNLTQDELDRLKDIQESRDQDPAVALREALQRRDPVQEPTNIQLETFYNQLKESDPNLVLTKPEITELYKQQNTLPGTEIQAPATETTPVGLSPEERAQQTEDFIQRVQTSATLQESDFTELPNHLAEKLMDLQGKSDKPITRFDAMTEMSKVVEDQNAPEQDRNSAALFIADIIHQNRDLFKGTLPEFLQNTPHDNPHFKALVDLFRNLGRMEQNPRIADALRFAQDELNISDDAQIDPTTPQGQQTIRNVVGAATHAPARMNQKVANHILRQADEGKANLTPQQAKNLRAAVVLQAEGQRASGPAAATPVSGAAETPASPAGSRSAPQVKTTSQDFVARQIETEGGTNPHQRSIREHVAEIGRAVASGKPKRIKESVQDLVNFAKSHTNKVNALNESIDNADGKNVPYQALSSNGSFYNNKKGVGVNLGNSGSENFARQVHKEATALVNLANHFIGEHPELKIDPLPEPPALKLSEEGSTTTESATSTPATTSGTSTTGQSEPSSSATSSQGQTSTAELTPEQKKLRGLDLKELNNRIFFFEKQRIQNKGKLSPQATQTLADLQAELARRKEGKPVETIVIKPSEGTHEQKINAASRIKQTEAAKLSDEELKKKLEEAKSKLPSEGITDEYTSDAATYRVLANELTKRKLASKPAEAKPAEAPVDPDLAAYESMASEQSGMDQDSVDRFAEEIAAIEPMDADKAAKLIKEIKTRKPTREELIALNKYLETLSDEEFIDVYQNGDDNVIINPIIGKAATAIDEIIKDLSAAVGFDLSSLVRFVRGATFKEGPKGGQFNVVGPVILINQRVLDAFNAGNKQVSHGALQHLLTHEFAHVIDHHGNSLSNPDIFHTSSDPAFARDGSLWEQFQKLTNRPAIESFNYPLFNYIGDQTSPEVFANEFFAELTAFVLNEQSIARDFIPEGVQAIEEALQRTAAARQLSRSGTLDTGTTDRGVPEGSQTTETINIWHGSGENVVLSNLAPRPFTYEGRDYRSVEHAYQSLKSGEFDQETYDKYLKGNVSIKRAGNKGTKVDDGYNINLMEQLMQASFDQNPTAQQALRDTGQAELTHTQDKGIWRTEFPRILTAIRDGLAPTAAQTQAAEEAAATEGQDEGSTQTKPRGKPVRLKGFGGLKAAIEGQTEETTEPEKKTKAKLEPVEQTTPDEETGPESVPLDQAYKDLATSEEGNFFLKSYKRTKKLGSRLMSVSSPLALMRSLLSDKVAHGNAVGNTDSFPRNRGIWKEYMDLAGQMIDNFKIRFDKVVTSKVDDDGNPKTSWLDLMDEGSAVNRYMTLKTMNLLEKVDGVHRFNKQLLESAMLASMDWLLNIQDRLANEDAEGLGSILGVDATAITDEILSDWNRGIGLSQAKRSLAQHLKRFWDVQDNKDVSETYVQGVAEAVALELMISMEEAGLLKTGLFKAPVGKGLDYGMVYFNTRPDLNRPGRSIRVRDEDTEILMRKFGEERNTISDAALVDKFRTGRSVGEPITEIPQHQLYNPNVLTTNQQKKAAANVQAARHMTNMPMVNFMKFLGLETYVNAMGGAAFDPEKTNVNDAKSKNGVRLGLVSAFNAMLGHAAEVEAYSERTGIPVSEVPTFFEYALLNLGRLQMRGLFNGQASKLARNVVTPVRAKIDLSQPGSRKFSDFMQAIGQGLGAKPEGKSRREVVVVAMAAINKQRSLIDIIKAHLQDEKQTPATKTEADLFINAGLDDHAFQALLEYARYEVSRETGGDLTRFESWNFLEADGKTNGPINALMLWAQGQITPRFLQLVAKGGMFFGVNNKTLDQHGDKIDLYKAAGNRGSEKVGHLRTAIQNDKSPKVLAQFDAFRRVMSALNIDVVVKGDQIELTRGFAKNRLTITVYGSGANGIAIKAANELANFIYAAHSEALQAGVEPGDIIYRDQPGQSFDNDLDMLLDNTPGISKDMKYGHKYFTRPVRHGSGTRNPKATRQEYLRDFTLTTTEFDALRDNVQFFLTDPLVEAITEEVMGEIAPVLKAMQKATQIQSIVVRNMFRNKVLAKLADKRIDHETKGGKYPDYHRGDFLSQNELNEIFDSLKQFAAVIDTGTQRYQINSREGTDVFEKAIIEHEGKQYTIEMPRSFATSLTGKMRTPIFMNVPRLAGVKVIPYLNIGSGDGQMMLHGMSIDTHRSDISQRTLPVFDGLNMPIDQILEYSRLINESVFKTWTQNSPMRAIAESFRTFAESRPIEQVLEDNPLNTTRQDTIKEMSKIEGGREPDDLIDTQGMNDLIDELLTELDGYADDLESRQQVYRETTQSIDQMASGKGPHNVKGTGSLLLAPGMSDQEIAMVMEGRRLELNAAKAKARGERQAVPTVPASTPVAKLSPAMQAVINLGTEDVTGVRVVQASQLMEVVKHLADIREDQAFVRQLLRAIGLNQKATDQEYRIVFGTPTQLDAWERANNADRFQEGSNDTPKGKIDSVAKIITVSNLVPETVIHELLHAATIEKLMAYYGGRAKRGLLSETDQDAIKRIEGLMNEWLLLDFKEADQANASGSQLSQSASLYWINKGIAEGDQNKYMAQAVNEFMAWTLTNQQAKTKARTIKNSAFRIFGAALETIKNLLFGKSLKVANNLLAQLQFNTRVLISTPTPIELLRSDANSVTMFQSAAFGNNDRLTYFRDRFQQKITAYQTEGDPNTIEGITQRYQRSNELRAARTATRQMVVSFVQHFGDLKKMQAWATFYEMQVGLMTEMQLNPNSLARIQELYDHVISNLEVKDFRENNDPNDQNDITQAQGKFDAVHGLFVKKTDPYGRTTLMSSFLALAMSSESFRKILSKIDKPKSDKSTNPSSKMDQILENVGNASVDWLSLMASGEGAKAKNVQEALDNLASAMIENVGDQRSAIEQRTEGFISGADRYFYDNIQALSGKGITKAENILANSTSKIARAGAKLLHVTSVIVNENASTKVAQGLVNALARYDGLHEIMAVANDIVLRTDENAPIYDMIAETKAVADQTRQRFREDLPEKLASQFSRPLTDEEWTAQHKIAATDIASLMATHGATGALRMVHDTAHRAAAIRSLEQSIRLNEGNRAAKILEKAEQLAFYMRTGKEGPNLLANAYAITKLFGEPGVSVLVQPHADTENSVDELVTLYAIRNLGQETKDTIANLSAENQKNKDGLEFIYHYLVGQRKDELDKAKGSQLGRINHYKGAMPSEQVTNESLRIESDTQHARMLKQGYTHQGTYTGSSADQNLSAKSYYYSPTAGLAPYRQGVMQTVHITASGVDPQTGYSVGKLIAGRITNGREIAQVQRQLRNQSQTNENLRMVYDDSNTVIAIERMADVAKTNTIQRNTNLAEMLGAWRGRQVEEIFAHEINRSLVNELYTIWDKAQSEGRANEFVNVLVSGDPVTQNTAKLIPNLMRDHIKSKFGKDTFMVHRSMVLNALGDRQASVADMFTSETRWNTPVQERFEKIAMGIFGNSAFNKLVASERTVQNIITNVKYNIVVKSVVIPMANLTANFGQLLNRGVPLRAILTGVPKKIVEINQYIKSRSLEIGLEADLRAARGKNDLNAIRKLEDRLQAMEDSYKRLSIYPLIKAGEFSTISNGNVTAEDLALADGKWSNFMDKMISLIPDGPLRTTARYGLVTRDTALFQALAKSVQYGDFIAKAILYDDLVNREQVIDEITLARRAFTNKEAIATVNQAFVPYNNLSGRGRHYLESMGLLWFYNYKIRIMKEAVYMLRHHPFRALLMAGIPGLNLIDSPMGSNFLSTLVDGNIGFSVGPEMAYHSWALNPWVNGMRSVF